MPKEPNVAAKEPMAVEVEAGKTYWWCACGLSKSQPFCDGSHKAEGIFEPVAWTAPETRKVMFCCCKRSEAAPICDYSHVTL